MNNKRTLTDDYGDGSLGSRIKVLNAWRDWIESWADNDFALTLNTRKVRWKLTTDEMTGESKWLYRDQNKDEIIECVREFANKLNEIVYKQSYRRGSKKLDIIWTLENAKCSVDDHIHMIIKGPTWLNDELMLAAVERALYLTDGYENERTGIYTINKSLSSDKDHWKLTREYGGWGEYITKEIHDIELKNLYIV